MIAAIVLVPAWVSFWLLPVVREDAWRFQDYHQTFWHSSDGSGSCGAGRGINQRLEAWLEHQLELSPWDPNLIPTLNETRWCYRCWCALEDAQWNWGPYNYEGWNPEKYRLQKLAELKKLLGPLAWYHGLMPPTIPYWRLGNTWPIPTSHEPPPNTPN